MVRADYKDLGYGIHPRRLLDEMPRYGSAGYRRRHIHSIAIMMVDIVLLFFNVLGL
jgi:hypothetical protein